MWRLVWRKQLRPASEEDLWNGLAGKAVRYQSEAESPLDETLPPYLYHFLRSVLHLSEQEIEGTPRDAAQALLNQHYSHDLRRE